MTAEYIFDKAQEARSNRFHAEAAKLFRRAAEYSSMYGFKCRCESLARACKREATLEAEGIKSGV